MAVMKYAGWEEASYEAEGVRMKQIVNALYGILKSFHLT